MMELLGHPARSEQGHESAKKSVKESKKSKREVIGMQGTRDVDTKKFLNKSQNNSTHHDNRDIGEYKEEDSSYHSKADYTEVGKVASIVLVTLKLSLQSKIMSLYKKTLRYFLELSKIPRRSYEEKRVKKWLIAWAKENDWEYEDDKSDNLLIKAPGSSSETLCLQGHMDMVCVSQESHDWSEEGVTVIKEDGILS